jgi:D-3-phosphoglycerate dehydrogenase
MKKFVMLDAHTLPEADYHQEKEILAGNVQCVIANCKTLDDIKKEAADADYIGVVYQKITDEVLDLMPNLKLIVRYGIGYDVVDVEACSKRNILVCNIPTYCIEDVATHAAALLLDVVRKVTMYDHEIKNGNWDVAFGYDNHRLSVQTLGLIGFGHIAQKFSTYVKPFGTKIIAFDPYLDDSVFANFGVEKVSLEELFASSDIISLHCACTEQTRHIINSNNIDKLKDGVLLVNSSRGALVENQALYEALKSGKIAAAGLDVNEDEPIKDKNHPLLSLKNLVITPHSAYNSVEASDEQHKDAAKTVINVARGEIPFNCVNKKYLTK